MQLLTSHRLRRHGSAMHRCCGEKSNPSSRDPTKWWTTATAQRWFSHVFCPESGGNPWMIWMWWASYYHMVVMIEYDRIISCKLFLLGTFGRSLFVNLDISGWWILVNIHMHFCSLWYVSTASYNKDIPIWILVGFPTIYLWHMCKRYASSIHLINPYNL